MALAGMASSKRDRKTLKEPVTIHRMALCAVEKTHRGPREWVGRVVSVKEGLSNLSNKEDPHLGRMFQGEEKSRGPKSRV